MANLKGQVDMSQITGTIRINDGPGLPGQIIVETEMVDISTNLPKADDRWTYTDAVGHFHAYDQAARHGDRYPTLNARVEHRECDGLHAYPTTDEYCEGYDVTLYSCRICGEEIKPGTIPGPHYETMAGGTSWRAKVSMPVNQAISLLNSREQVSVRAEFGEGQVFGVAVVSGDITIESWREHTTLELVGMSPLGRQNPVRVPA
jgi:hypothetical protein